MLHNDKKRYSSWARRKYHNNVQEYLQNHGFEIVQKIYTGALNTHELTDKEIAEVLIGNYPIAPWVDKQNIVGQFVAMLEDVGYSFSYNMDGKYCFRDDELYGTIVKNHLRFSGCCILDCLADYCQQNGGKLTYYQAQKALGLRYPKAPYVDKADTRACIILFLKETGIPFIFTDTYIYFP